MPPGTAPAHPSYPALLRTRGAWHFSLAGWLGRLNRVGSVVGTIVLLVASGTSYAAAGVIAAVVVVGGAIGGPAWSRAADRWGQRPILLPAAAAAVLSAAGFTAVVLAGAPVAVQALLGFALGLSIADPGALVRARWMHLLPRREDRHAALAIETALDEMAFLLGLPLLTAIAALVPAAGLLSAAVTGAVGFVALRLLTASIPPVVPPATSGASLRLRSWLPAGVAPVLAAFVGVGLLFGFINLTGVAVTEEAGMPALAGVVIGAFSIGAVVAGLGWGVLAPRLGSRARLIAATAVFALLVPLLSLSHEPLGFGILAAVAGAGFTPLLIAATAAIEEVTPLESITVAMTWPPVAMSAGNALGSTLTGAALDAGGVTGSWAVPLVGVAFALLGLATFLVARRARGQAVSASSAAAS